MAKDIRGIDYQFNEFKNSFSEIKDKFMFLKCSVITLIHNARLLNIKYK